MGRWVFRILAALSLALGSQALAQADDAPLNAPATPPSEPCAAIHRTSPEFAAAFAPLAEAGDDPDAAAFLAVLQASTLASAARGPASERLLATGMLPVARTDYDAAWRRVRDTGLSPACVERLLGREAQATRPTTLAAVNRWVNRSVTYVEDPTGDAWADAATTLRTRRGDCEDLAVAKLQLLVALGVPPEDLYLTLARDLVRQTDHAVLIARDGGRFWLLDSATDRLLDAAAPNDYRAMLSYSAARKWLHGK